MINKKNIYKFIVSFQSILISTMIPINIPIPSIKNIYKIVEIPINYQIPTIIFLTLIFSGEFIKKVYAIYIFVGLFFLFNIFMALINGNIPNKYPKLGVIKYPNDPPS